VGRRSVLVPRFAIVATALAVTAAAFAAFDDDGAASQPTCASVQIEAGLSGCTPMNKVQVVGTHNSYHVATDHGGVTHPPLTVQLQAGIRQLELDVHAPAATQGFSVFHAAPYDTGTRCPALLVCLRQIARWSAGHPSHVPLMVLLEMKDGRVGRNDLDRLDAAVRSEFTRRDLLVPDDIRSGSPTLAAAVRRGRWPTLATVRGRTLFVLDNGGDIRETYLSGHPSLRERVMFTNAPAGADDEAITEVNDPLSGNAAIRHLVAAGVMVRTRADTDLTPTQDLGVRRRAAVSSGAQWISTDYPAADPGPAAADHVLLGTQAAAQIDPLSPAPTLAAVHRR
jgi:hypothetical protein